MSRIICDVCGTSYPETADQCPICGSAKPEATETIPLEMETPVSQAAAAPSGYTHVKGGRFSKSNVRKRNKPAHGRHEEASAEREDRREKSRRENREPAKSNKGLVAAVVILLLAILAVVGFIAVRYFLPDLELPFGKEDTVPTTTAPTTVSTTAPDLSCKELVVSDSEVTLDGEGNAWLLNVKALPENTEDEITYESADPSVATVSSEGRITAVAPGETVITIRCGKVEQTCTVICDFQEETTAPTTEPTTVPTTAETVPEGAMDLNREEFSMFYRGDSWNVYEGPLDPTLINWWSDNTNVAVIEDGLVTATGEGTTTVYGEYLGVEVSCIVHCDFS